jgi:C1A family cysteine protease
VFAGVIAAQAQVPQEPVMAPQPPEDQRDMPPGRGFIPPRLDLSHLTAGQPIAKAGGFVLPTSWDWRTEGKVTSVKNQGVCGACYSFASIANFESLLLIDGLGAFDLSENNAKECNYDEAGCGGGSFEQMANWFAQSGVVLESCDPYEASDVVCNSGCTVQKTLLDWRIISGADVPETAILKQYINDHGPIYTSMYTGDSQDPTWENEYNNYDGSYVLHYTGTWPTNHAVLIVGWDDEAVHAGGTGAWIVKNSWSTGWGGPCGYGVTGGYFKIAYGSANIGMWSSFIQDYQESDPDGELLYHDEAGSTSYWGYGTTTAWSLVKFTPNASAYLRRVEFWTNDLTTDVDIYVYDSFNGSAPSNILTTQLDNSFTEAGYHSVALDSPPSLIFGDAVYVVLKVTNSGYGYPIVADGQGPSTTATTYLSSSGSAGSWYDLGAGMGDDIGVRIRTSPTLGLAVDDKTLPDSYAVELGQNYPNPFNPSTTISFELTRRSNVQVVVYNLLGQVVKRLVDCELAVGNHEVTWDGNDETGRAAATGVYLYSVISDLGTETRKMLLLK